ncbi:MAG: beta-galactosidase [Lentisphaeria bacterium]|nr:beta-galactosidase [Lentisphaeria bacterium]
MKKYLIIAFFMSASILFGWSKDGTPAWRLTDDSPVSDHRSFANPKAGKIPVALMLLNGIAQREVIELQQRFEYRYILLPVYDRNNFSPFAKYSRSGKNIKVYGQAMTLPEYEKELQDILDKLPECDLIVLGKIQWENIPSSIQQKFLERVKAGASMFIIGFDGKAVEFPNVELLKTQIDFPLEKIPALKNTITRCGEMGKGMVMTVDYPQLSQKLPDWVVVEALTPFESDDPLYYDYALAFIAKCIMQLTEPHAPKVVASGENSVTVFPLPAGASLVFTAVDRFGRNIASRKMAAASNASAAFKDLPASARMIEVKLLDPQDKTIDFTLLPLEIAEKELISGIEMKKDIYLPDENICGNVKLKKVLKGKIRISLTDERKKLIFDQELPFDGMVVPFDLNVFHQQSRYAQLSVALLDNGKIVDEKRKNIYFNTDRSGEPDDFLFGMWSYAISNSRVNSLWLDSMRDEGIDFVMCASSMHSPVSKMAFTPRNVKRHGMDYASYITRLSAAVEFRLKRPCPFAYYEKFQQTGKLTDENGLPFDKNTHFLKWLNELKDIGVVFYNLGDENHLAFHMKDENCFCDNCQRRFRIYLKKVYGSLDKVNRSYNSKYSSFDEIKAQNFEKSMRAGKYSLWLDYRLFMEEEFVKWHMYKTAQIRAVDKKHRIGIEGMVYPTLFWQGYNLPKMLKNFNFCAPYFNTRDIHALKYSAPGTLKSAWFGTYETTMGSEQLKQTVWRYLFAGLHGVFYWYSGEPLNTSSFTTTCISAPGLKPLPQFSAPTAEVKLIRESGIGKLLINSKAVNDGIWIHYSNNSMIASVLSPDKSTWEISVNEFTELLDSIGAGYDLATPEEIIKGIPANIKVLILPYALAVSDAEFSDIEKFVSNGGLLIADHDPAVLDEHGKMRKKSPFLKIFKNFSKMHIVKYGKGYAAYLNNFISGANIRIQKGDASGIQYGMLRLLNKAGVNPAARITDRDGNLYGTMIYQHGSDRYITLLAQRSKQESVVKKAAGAEGGASALSAVGGSFERIIELNKPMHIYDVLKKRYLGKLKKFDVMLDPAVGRVIACVENPVEAPEIRLSEKTKKVFKPGEMVEFTMAQIHNAAIFTVTAADGRKVFEKRVSGNKCRFIPAYNDPAGKYTAQLQQVIGGKKTVVEFSIKK